MVFDSVTQKAEEAQLSIVLAAFSSLASLDRDQRLDMETRKQLHAAFWQGTHHQKINVPMDNLADLIADLPKQSDKPVCEICGERLYWDKDRTTPTVDTTSPTSPDYAWRDPRDGPPDYCRYGGLAAD